MSDLEIGGFVYRYISAFPSRVLKMRLKQSVTHL